jgi:putative acetyltransferase
MGELIIRHAEANDAEAIVRVHHAAVQGTAASCYPQDVLDGWSGPVTPERVEWTRRALTGGDEICLLAEVGGQVVGFGSICPAESGLRSLYVDPRAGRRGVGSRLLVALERMAAAHGARVLVLDASLNAAGFYARRGFEVIGQGTHRLRSGQEMACVRMRKSLPHSDPQPEVLPPSL